MFLGFMDWLKPTEEGDMSFWASVCAIHPWHWIIQSGSFHSGLSSSPRKYKQVLGQPPPTTALMNVTYSIVDIAMILVMIMIYHDLHCECKWFWLFWLPWLFFFLTIANLPGWVTTSCNLNSTPFRRVPLRGMGLMCLSKPSTMEAFQWAVENRCALQGLIDFDFQHEYRNLLWTKRGNPWHRRCKPWT